MLLNTFFKLEFIVQVNKYFDYFQLILKIFLNGLSVKNRIINNNLPY